MFWGFLNINPTAIHLDISIIQQCDLHRVSDYTKFKERRKEGK